MSSEHIEQRSSVSPAVPSVAEDTSKGIDRSPAPAPAAHHTATVDTTQHYIVSHTTEDGSDDDDDRDNIDDGGGGGGGGGAHSDGNDEGSDRNSNHSRRSSQEISPQPFEHISVPPQDMVGDVRGRSLSSERSGSISIHQSESASGGSAGQNISDESRQEHASRWRSPSSSSLSQQAQFTFSSPTQMPVPSHGPRSQVHDSQQQSRKRYSTGGGGGRYQYPSPYQNTGEQLGSGITSPKYPDDHSQHDSAHGNQAEEDIRMSESPPPRHGVQSNRGSFSDRRLSDDSTEVSFSEHGGNRPAPDPYFASPHHQGHRSQQQQPQQHRRDSQSRGQRQAVQIIPGIPAPDASAVTMPINSIVMYHTSYNSGRGAVWRFFQVIEQRVSGNTDRAECMLCKKRMLGKSADMKKHIVHSCPSRHLIPEELEPVLEIVRGELEHPKTRAKRSLPSGSSGGGRSPNVGPQPAGKLQVSTSGLHSGAYSSHPHGGSVSAYDTEPHRAKFAKYSRHDPRGSSNNGSSGGSGAGGYPMSAGATMGSPPIGSQGSYSAHPSSQPSSISTPLPHPAPHQQQMQQQHHHPRQQSHPVPPPMSDKPIRSPPPQPPHPPQHGQSFGPPGHGGQARIAPRAGGGPPPPPSAQQPSHQTSSGHPPQYYAHTQGGPTPPSHHQQHQPPPPSSRGPSGSGQPPSHQQQQQERRSSMYSPPGGQTPPPLNSARLKARLRDGVPAFGVWLSIPSPVTARMVAAQGFDWACIDMEHSPLNPTLMADMVAAVASTGTCAPIVRVPSHAPEYFKWALDAGAHGVIVPMVNTRDEMVKVLGYCKYPPEGRRSYGAFFAPQSFGIRGPGAISEYTERANQDILVIPQIESAEAVSNATEILSVNGIDAIFIGPYDLQASLGAHRPVEDSYDSRFLAAQSAVIQAAEARNIPRGVYTSSGAAARSKLASRFTLVVAANDLSCLMGSTGENLGRAKSDPRGYR